MRLVLLVLMMILPLPAAAFTAQNGMTVVRQSQTEIEVIYRARRVDTDYWCAAGDYALRVLGASGTQRIYITRGRGTPETSDRLQSVQFSLTLPAGVEPQDGLFLKMKQVGDNLGVAFAQNYCLDRKNLEF